MQTDHLSEADSVDTEFLVTHSLRYEAHTKFVRYRVPSLQRLKKAFGTPSILTAYHCSWSPTEHPIQFQKWTDFGKPLPLSYCKMVNAQSDEYIVDGIFKLSSKAEIVLGALELSASRERFCVACTHRFASLPGRKCVQTKVHLLDAKPQSALSLSISNRSLTKKGDCCLLNIGL